jgi:hypothetical protein
LVQVLARERQGDKTHRLVIRQEWLWDLVAKRLLAVVRFCYLLEIS